MSIEQRGQNAQGVLPEHYVFGQIVTFIVMIIVSGNMNFSLFVGLAWWMRKAYKKTPRMPFMIATLLTGFGLWLLIELYTAK